MSIDSIGMIDLSGDVDGDFGAQSNGGVPIQVKGGCTDHRDVGYTEAWE